MSGITRLVNNFISQIGVHVAEPAAASASSSVDESGLTIYQEAMGSGTYEVVADEEKESGSDTELDPNQAFTENGASSFKSTGNKNLDLFFKLVRGMEWEELEKFSADAWVENPEIFLKLVCQTRDCRGGKGEKKLFFLLAKWLRLNKPKTYNNFLPIALTHGCFKDILQIISSRYEAKDKSSSAELQFLADQLIADRDILDGTNQETSEAPAAAAEPTLAKSKKSISLVAKWCPNENSHYDHGKQGRLATKLARLVFPMSATPDKDYRKLLVSLRKHIDLVETRMCNREWDQIVYSHVPAICMSKSSKIFKKHDEDRYNQYLRDLKTGKSKVNVQGIQPHELIKKADDPMAQEQFNALVAKLTESGSLVGSLAVCDVSGSMNGLPMDVAIALSLVLSQVTTGPFANHIITFSANPTFYVVDRSATLSDKVEGIKGMEWGMNTNMEAVFDLVLQKAIDSKVGQEWLPKNLFIFSDMQFDSAVGQDGYRSRDRTKKYISTWQLAKAKYEQAGYTIPQVIFWNLRAGTVDFPMGDSQTPGVSMVSGFSADLLKVFLSGKEFNAQSCMEACLEKYVIPEETIEPSEI